MKSSHWKKLLVTLTAIAGLAAFAHGKDGVHLKGTVKAVDGHSLTVTSTESKDVTVHFDASAKFERADTPTTSKDVVVGERVVVHAKKEQSGVLKVLLVKLGKREPAPTKPAEPTVAPKTQEGAHEHGNH